MDLVEATAVIAEGIPLLHPGAETSVAAVHFQPPPADSMAVSVQPGGTMAVGVITVVADITVAGDITAQGSDSVSTRLTPMLLAFAIRLGSTISMAFGGSIPVAQFRTAIKASPYGGPSRGGPRGRIQRSLNG
jgi:hypothetical protein